MKTEVILSALEAKHPGEKEYLQAVKEVLLSIEEVYNQHPKSTWDIVCNSTTRSARTRAVSASILLSTCPS